MKNRRIAGAGAVLAVAAVLLAGCPSQGPEEDTAQGKAQAVREEVNAAQEAAVPYPAQELKNPLDRRNLRDRLLRNNNPNAISYVYIMSNTGDVVGYFVIKGKLTSTESAMLPTDAVIDACSSTDYCAEVVQGGGDDGTYGPNEGAVFGFTAQGIMITFSFDNWFQSDAPIGLNVPDLTPRK